MSTIGLQSDPRPGQSRDGSDGCRRPPGPARAAVSDIRRSVPSLAIPALCCSYRNVTKSRGMRMLPPEALAAFRKETELLVFAGSVRTSPASIRQTNWGGLRKYQLSVRPHVPRTKLHNARVRYSLPGSPTSPHPILRTGRIYRNCLILDPVEKIEVSAEGPGWAAAGSARPTCRRSMPTSPLQR